MSVLRTVPESAVEITDISDEGETAIISDIGIPPSRPHARIDRSSEGLRMVVTWKDTEADEKSPHVIGAPLAQKPLSYMVKWKTAKDESSKEEYSRTTREQEMKIDVKAGQTYFVWVLGLGQNDRPGPPSDTLTFRSAPKCPTELKVLQQKNDRSNSIEVEFEDPDDRPKQYSVFYRNLETNDKDFIETDTKNCEFTGLIPGGRYEIYVQAKETNNNLTFFSSKKSCKFTLRLSQTQNLQCTPNEEGYQLTWDEVHKAETYEISWGSGPDEKRISNSTFYDFSAGQLEPAKTYEITVCALDNEEKPSRPGVMRYRTVPRMPSNIRVNMKGNSAVVAFESSGDENTYEVVAQSTDEGTPPIKRQKELSPVELPLEPDMEYRIWVYAIHDNKRSSRALYKEVVQTHLQSPKNLKCFACLEGYKLSWDKVQEASNYRIKWSCSSVESKDALINSCYFTTVELGPAKCYEISVSALDGKRESKPEAIEFVTGPVAPSKITIMNENGSILVNFKDDSEMENTYEVAAQPTKEGQDPILVTTDIPCARLCLQRGVSYKLSVCTIHNGKRSRRTKYEDIVTFDYTARRVFEEDGPYEKIDDQQTIAIKTATGENPPEKNRNEVEVGEKGDQTPQQTSKTKEVKDTQGENLTETMLGEVDKIGQKEEETPLISKKKEVEEHLGGNVTVAMLTEVDKVGENEEQSPRASKDEEEKDPQGESPTETMLSEVDKIGQEEEHTQQTRKKMEEEEPLDVFHRRLSEEIDRRVKQASQKNITVGASGGSLKNFGWTLTIPARAFHVDTEVKTSVITDFPFFSEEKIHIAPMIMCGPPGQLNEPVRLEVETWACPARDRPPVYAEVFWKETMKSAPKFLRRVPIGEDRMISFETNHFTIFEIVLAVSDWFASLRNLQIPLQSYVYAHPTNKVITCVCCKDDSKVRDDVDGAARSLGSKLVLFPETLHAYPGETIPVKIKCQQPLNLRIEQTVQRDDGDEMTVVPEVEKEFHVDRVFKKSKQLHYLPITLNGENLNEFAGTLKLGYSHTDVDGIQEHPMIIEWPFPVPDTNQYNIFNI